MLDFRYHALSLAAVLCALAVGVLIGIAIGDSSLVSSAQDGLVHSLRSEVRVSQRNLELAGQQLSDEQTLVSSFWPLAVHELLAGRTVGLVFLGESSDEVDSLVQDGVKEAAGEVRSVIAVREPPDTTALAGQLASLGYGALASQPRLLRRLAVHIGEEMVAGGHLLERTRAKLLSSYDGQLGAVEGVVVMRSEPAGMSAAASQAAAALDSGLIAGLKAKGVPVVGVELSSTEPSQVAWYKAEGLSSVDDLQEVGGRAAMAFALAGYRGAFGTKSTADAPLPSPSDAPSVAGRP
ncbi:MAG TPA: copper transporter [Solirubrobacteraceae bacterium]|nr:copper transporter [Solirubrobacteraceae bacterium]